MMRLVFLMSAEDRDLMPMDSDAFRPALCRVASARRSFARRPTNLAKKSWSGGMTPGAGLLATFRAVHGGVQHQDLMLPAYGGSLFDPGSLSLPGGAREGHSCGAIRRRIL